MTKVYLLLRETEVQMNGYYVATETDIVGVYATRQAAIHEMYQQDDDPMVDCQISEREVM